MPTVCLTFVAQHTILKPIHVERFFQVIVHISNMFVFIAKHDSVVWMYHNL